MKRTALRKFSFLILLLLISGTGCATAKSLYDAVDKPKASTVSTAKPDKSAFKKKVLILPFLNQAGMTEERYQKVVTTFSTLVEKDQNLLLDKSGDPIPSTVKSRSPRFGIVIDPDVAKKAEEMGMNVLITVVLNPVELTLIRTGIWPFRKLKREIEMSMVVNALDITNGTLFLTHIESEKMRFAVDEIEEEEEPKKPGIPEINDKTFNKLWSPIIERQASALRVALRNQPWTGRILSADNQTVIINAGKDVGLATGSVFEVFGRGDPVRSASGRSIYLLGPKVGEIKTVNVMQDRTSAIPLTEARFKAGQLIRMKN